MVRTLWVNRVFTFDIPEGWLHNIVERLNGTLPRIEFLILKLNEKQLEFKPEANVWSIKEHIGHLSDLEELHDGRIDDFTQRLKKLRAADMGNVKTNNASHNSVKLDSLLSNFNRKRTNYICRLNELDDQTQQFKSLHPRLNIMMKPVDMAFFTAEHDDHHLATINELAKNS